MRSLHPRGLQYMHHFVLLSMLSARMHPSLTLTDAHVMSPAAVLQPAFHRIALPKGVALPPRLPNFWYGPPAGAALAARERLSHLIPAGFSGRAGILVAADGGGNSFAALALDPISMPSVTTNGNIDAILPFADALVEPLEDEDFIHIAEKLILPLASGPVGASRTLLSVAQELTEGRPKTISRGGGAGLKLTFRHWNRAMVLAMRAPAAQLLALCNTCGRRMGLTPAAYMEWWTGEVPAHDVKHEGMLLSPRTTAKPVIERMLAGWPVAPDPRLTNPRVRSLAPTVIEESADWVVVEKPSGLLSVPGAMGLPDAMTMTAEMIGTTLVPVHRLDMDTSGLLVYAKTEAGTKSLMAAFREGKVDKRYRAKLIRPISPALGSQGTVRLPITTNPLDRLRQCCAWGGRPAETRWTILTTSDDGVEVALEPVTGRTHQLRIHAAHPQGLNAPIANDPYYGPDGIGAETPETPLALHAALLDFPDPATGERRRYVSRPAFSQLDH